MRWQSRNGRLQPTRHDEKRLFRTSLNMAEAREGESRARTHHVHPIDPTAEAPISNCQEPLIPIVREEDPHSVGRRRGADDLEGQRAGAWQVRGIGWVCKVGGALAVGAARGERVDSLESYALWQLAFEELGIAALGAKVSAGRASCASHCCQDEGRLDEDEQDQSHLDHVYHQLLRGKCCMGSEKGGGLIQHANNQSAIDKLHNCPEDDTRTSIFMAKCPVQWVSPRFIYTCSRT